jgi:hypothetical protein
MKPKHLAPAQSEIAFLSLIFKVGEHASKEDERLRKLASLEKKRAASSCCQSARGSCESEVVTYDAVGFSRMNQPHDC